MFKLVVLFAIFAVAMAKPGYLHAALPVATSYQSRVDVHSKPAVVAYSAPVVAAAPLVSTYAAAAPVVSTYAAHAPVVATSYAAYPSAVSHQSRVDYHSNAAYVAAVPAVRAYHAGVYAAPAIHAW